MVESISSIQDEYMLGRSFRESARLHVQHWMWRYRLGYLLHPLIPTSSEMRIVDVGTGNACWLLELASQSPNTWHLEGLDVSTLNYPANEYLPSNISLKAVDILSDIPENLVGRFDVVHIRTFCIVVKKGDPVPLLNNLLKMLKPGGYIQWDEMDCASFSAHSPNEDTCKENADELLRLWQKFAAKADLEFSWLSDLYAIFEKNGLEVVDSFRLPISDELRKASTDNFMVALEGIGAIATGKDSTLLGSHEDFRTLFKKAVLETQDGVTISMDMIVAVGRKLITRGP